MNKTYAFSDIHGKYNLWKSIKHYCNDTDTIICLGDVIDRGPDGLKIMKELFNTPNVTYLMGNHELMMMQAIKNLYYDGYYSDMCNVWLSNGGYTTLEAFQQESREEQETIYKKLCNLPVIVQYKNKNNQHLFLTHAGGDANIVSQNTKDIDVWNRNHIYNQEWDGPDNLIIVHGHTPVQYIRNDWGNVPTIEKYCNGHKINIDMGSYTANITCLLDLDILEPIYIQ